jgi:hypothetical protein
MEFDEAPTLNNGHRQVQQLVFTIYQNGVDDLSYDPRILKIQQGVNMLLSFLRDHSREVEEGSYEVTVRYRSGWFNGVQRSLSIEVQVSKDAALCRIEVTDNRQLTTDNWGNYGNTLGQINGKSAGSDAAGERCRQRERQS